MRSRPAWPGSLLSRPEFSCVLHPGRSCDTGSHPHALALPFKGRVGWGWCCSLRSSFQRKLEAPFNSPQGWSSSFCSGFSASARADSHPCEVRPASLRAGSFSLLAQRKGTKRKGSPASAPSAHPARKVRVRRPVAPTAHPCADGAMSAIHRAPPSGRFGHRPPPLKGPGKAKAARSCAQKPKRKPASTAA